METNDIKEQKKKVYQKPEITAIDLAADEVLATGCKTSTGSANPSFPQCSPGGACSTNIGS